ncbi:hypothetical protein SDRG_14978 [Saprolegnia diclina VS20]|uniref:RNA polymerase II subunit A C-terminal domain phosphatase n=1 Tax=Saprolegnia diclina (strain VS20) TaxID=1156394 RepID=T0Q1C5_SAPDV|nr:hypothetical protein SDRG_14978 [Saprolegnia diclina VS20]EQC27175.1 hypothetical protein SDRG_14978 [Saprolegnia diclina VS20]|eukprot:XP_008619362.1 hypothetical protein SDRG_14978 [Saprolegnia diclina VS20]
MAAQFLALQCKAHVALSWTCTDGQLVHAEQIIASYGSPSESSFGSIIAPATGTLTILPLPADDVPPGTDVEIGRIEVCMHPMIQNNRCVVCMSKVEAGETVKVILAQGQIMEVNRATAQELDSENIGRMLKQKKLVLVLDLDHTLLHAVRSQDVVDAIDDDALRFYIRDIPTEHVLQLRPGLSTFLSELSSLYDLHIYTHGTRKYAERIAEIIDPDNSLFHHRIVARTDTPDVAHKSLKLLFPSCDDSMIVVLDDRVDVWKENAGNVFIIEAFHHFNTRAEINNASGGAPSNKERKRQDNHLTKALRVLKLVHEKFYQSPGSTSVKAIMEQMRHAVLRGCHIAFSGVIPIGVAPESDYLWKLALSFGAKPSMTMDNFPTTHLVIHPKRLGTKKYLEALAMPSVNVVSPQWLIDCASEWMRLREDRYRIRSLVPATEPTRDDSLIAEVVTATDNNEDEEETKQVDTTEAETTQDGDAVAVLPLSKLRPLPSKGLLRTAKKAPEDRKTVTFDALPEKIEAPFTTAMRRKRPLPPTPVAAPKPAVVKGVVATGGSFDFLSKMATRKKTAPVVVKPAMPLKPAMPQAVRANDDDDDIFRRLMLAEKLEEEDADTKPKRKFDGTPRPHEKRSKVVDDVQETADAQRDADMDDDDDDEDFINALENDL